MISIEKIFSTIKNMITPDIIYQGVSEHHQHYEDKRKYNACEAIFWKYPELFKICHQFTCWRSKLEQGTIVIMHLVWFFYPRFVGVDENFISNICFFYIFQLCLNTATCVCKIVLQPLCVGKNNLSFHNCINFFILFAF